MLGLVHIWSYYNKNPNQTSPLVFIFNSNYARYDYNSNKTFIENSTKNEICGANASKYIIVCAIMTPKLPIALAKKDF